MASRPPDSAILDLGDIGEQNVFEPSSANTATSHTFDDKLPDSALDLDNDDIGGTYSKNIQCLQSSRFKNPNLSVTCLLHKFIS